MKSCTQYIAECKVKLGNPRMSDRELGEHVGYIQQNIARAKSGMMSDPLAIKLAQILQVEPGEILMVARMERERDPHVQKHLARWVHHMGKALASMPAKAINGVGALLLVVLMSFLPARDAQAVGGAGRF